MPQFAPILATDAVFADAVAGTAVALTLPAYFNNTGGKINHGRCRITVRSARIIFTVNGTAPLDQDETKGEPVDVDGTIILDTLTEMRNFKCIRATPVSGAITALFEKRLD